MINAVTFEVIKKSPVPNIGGRNYIAYNPGIVLKEDDLSLIDYIRP